jgi:diguanylate cyclase (GGDEF)-like protein/PAS domain S-box-containing protein
VLVACSDSLAGVLIYHQPIRSFGEIFGSAGLACWYAAAAYLLRGPLRINMSVLRGRDVVRYLAVTTAAALGATATGVTCLAADHTIPWSDFWSSGQRWFVGDEIGLLGLAPFLLIHVFPWVRNNLSQQVAPPSKIRNRTKINARIGLPLLEGMGQTLLLVAVLWIMFRPGGGNYLFLSFIPLLWMAMRQGVARVATGIVAFTFGVIVAMHLSPPPPSIFSKIGVLMLVVSAAGLIVGSTVTERHLVETDLRGRTANLNSLIENSPLGIVVLNQEGSVELVNEAFTKLFLLEKHGELAGRDLDELLSDSQDQMVHWSGPVLAGQALHRTVRRSRKDGMVLDLEIQAVPLVVDGLVTGAYTICRDISEQVRASQAEREHAVALNRLVKELEVQTDQMSLLNEMASLLECCATIKEACTVVQESTRKLFPDAISGGLYTFRASRNLVEGALSWGDSGPSQAIFSPEACWALRRGQPHWSNTARAGITCPHLNESPAGAHVCVPMVGLGETLGILNLGFGSVEVEPPTLSDSRQRLAVAAAAQIAVSLASLQLRETLRSQSIRDPLTGLFNRRFMQESLDKEIVRAKRKNRPLSVLFLDIDHFKRFNDTFGHEAGDLVLQSVGELLTTFFREDDVACRWGGEEFAVILPEAVSEQAVARANSLRGAVKELRLQHQGTVLATITFSIGVATFPEHASCSEELLRLADQCLYQSKASGRDCVTIANPVPA